MVGLEVGAGLSVAVEALGADASAVAVEDIFLDVR